MTEEQVRQQCREREWYIHVISLTSALFTARLLSLEFPGYKFTVFELTGDLAVIRINLDKTRGPAVRSFLNGVTCD